MDKVVAAFSYKYDIIVITERGTVHRLRISDLTDEVMSLQIVARIDLKS